LVFDKEELKKLIKEKGIGSTEDLNSFLRDVTKEVVEALYDGELTDHLGHDKHQKSESGNVRNGFSKKTVQTKSGEVDLEVPRDRDGSFDPQIVKKRQRDITGIQDKVISMFGLGMSTRDIQNHIDEIYGQSLSRKPSVPSLIRFWSGPRNGRIVPSSRCTLSFFLMLW
jgi:putative transposase